MQRCPACQSHIQLSTGEPHPRPRAVYRCHVCRLELLWNVLDQRFDVAPMIQDEKVTDSKP